MILPGPDNRCFKIMRGLICGWLAVLILAIYPYTEDPVTPIKTLVTGGAALLLSALWLLALMMGRIAVRPLGVPVYILLAFLALNCGAALLSEWPERSLHSLLPWTLFTIMALFAHQTFSHPRHLRNLFRTIVGATAIASAYGLLQHGGVDPFPWAMRDVEEYRALPATFGNPNFAGHTLVIAIILCGGLLGDAWRRGRRVPDLIGGGFAGILLLSHLYLTHMRGGAVALGLAAIAIAATIGLRRRIGSARIAWATSVAVMVLLLAGAAVTAMYVAPQLRLENSLQLRLHGYAGATAMILDHGITGVGPGNFAFQNIPYWSDFEALGYAVNGRRNQHVHNEWLEIAAECGVGGLFLFLLLFLYALDAPFQRRDKQALLRYTLPVALFAAGVDACFGFNLHVPVSGALIFILLALQPDGKERWLKPGRATIGAALLLFAFVVLESLDSVRRFQGERLFQQGQGALAWDQAGEDSRSGTDFAAAAWDRFSRAGQLLPWDFRIHMARADLNLSEGRTLEAIGDYQRARTLHPHLPRLKVALARAHLAAIGKGMATEDGLDQARQLTRAATRQCPDLGEAFAALGWVQLYQSDNMALESFETARSRGMAGDPSLELGLAQAAQLAGAPEKAAAALLRAIDRHPDAPVFWNRFAALANASNTSIAETYRQALRHGMVTRDSLALEWRAELAHRLVQYPVGPQEQAVNRKSLGRVLDNFPEADEIWAAWLQCLPEIERRVAFTERANTGGAIGPIARAAATILQDSQGDEVFQALASALETWPGMGDAPSGSRRYLPIVDLVKHAPHPSDLAKFQLGRALVYVGAWEEGNAMLLQAKASLPSEWHGELAYHRAWALAHLKQADLALELAQEAVRTSPASLPFQWNLALRLADAGQGAAARFQLEALLPQASANPAFYQAITAILETMPSPEGLP